ncbi:Putative ribonuclease H protein At1g65750, partial [Linum perenne]
LRRRLCDILGFGETTYLGRYLGVPILHGKASKDTYAYILKRMRRKLEGWKCNTLSLAGRVTLALSVLNSIPSYEMQHRFSQSLSLIVLMPLSVISPKDQGGLGLRKARELNQAYLMKLGWEILNNPNKLWVRVVMSKYLKETSAGPQLRRKSGRSQLWRGIRGVWHDLRGDC